MKLLKQSKESNIFNKLTGKRKEGRRTGKSSFPILLCVMIAIVSALIQYSILSTVGGVDNSRGFSFHRNTSSTNAKTTPKGQTSNKSAKNKSETSTETETESAPSAAAAKSQQNDKNSKAAKEEAKKNSDKSGKTWVPPVYKYVTHPAVTRTTTVYSCKGGTYSSMEALRDAQKRYIRSNHLPG